MKKRHSILGALGAFVTKGVTLKKRLGNPQPRVVETRSGIINSIGLQNSGSEAFIHSELPQLVRITSKYQLPIIVNISASTIDEFGELSDYLSHTDINRYISGLEINVSCPNIKEGGAAFGSDPRIIERVVRKVKNHVPDWITVITKLSPNVTEISDCGKAAIQGGTDALSMINTLRAMAIDIYKKEPLLGNKTGGLSGPAIKPIGVYMVYQCYRNIPECTNKKVKIIGIGGIANWRDALEYILAGASAIGIGTEWFVNNDVFTQVRDGINQYLRNNKLSFAEIVGMAHRE